MEEELQFSKDKTNQYNKNRKVFLILTRLVYGLIILAVFFGLLFLFWQISNTVYDKKENLDSDGPIQGTVDFYAKKEKSPPLSNFEMSPIYFEINDKDPISSGVIVKIQVILAYDALLVPTSKKNLLNSLEVELGKREHQMQDIIRDLLVRKTYAELKDRNNITRIKKELLNRINRVLVNGKIADIYLAQWDVIPR